MGLDMSESINRIKHNTSTICLCDTKKFMHVDTEASLCGNKKLNIRYVKMQTLF